MGKKQIDMLIIKEEVIAKLFDGTLLEHRIGNVELKSNWSQEHGKKYVLLQIEHLMARFGCVWV